MQQCIVAPFYAHYIELMRPFTLAASRRERGHQLHNVIDSYDIIMIDQLHNVIDSNT